MSVASAVFAGRAAAEALMDCTCTIRNPDGEPVYDRDSGQEVPQPGSVVYAGPCRVQVPNVVEENPDAGERAWTVQAAIVSIPVTATEPKVDDLVTIDAAALDEALVGVRYRVSAEHHKSHATARRLRCEEVTR